MNFDMTQLLQDTVNSRLATLMYSKVNSRLQAGPAVPDSTARGFLSRMRSDSRVALQGAQNMDDAASMVTIAQTGVTAIKDKLTQMRALLGEAANNNSMTANDYTTLQANLSALADGMVSTAKSTDFNGMKLLNGSAGMNADGVIQLQAGDSSFDQVFNNLVNSSLNGRQVLGANGEVNLNNMKAGIGTLDVTNRATVDDAFKLVTDVLDRITGIESQYSYDIKSLTNMSVLLKGQADTFSGVLKNHERTPKGQEADPQSYLLDLINGQTNGNIMSGLG